MAWRCVAAVGLKPPPRGHVVATGWVAAMMGRWRGRASGLAPVSDKANDAVEVAEDREDQALVVDEVVDEAGLVLLSMRWRSWWPAFGTRVGPLTPPSG